MISTTFSLSFLFSPFFSFGFLFLFFLSLFLFSFFFLYPNGFVGITTRQPLCHFHHSYLSRPHPFSGLGAMFAVIFETQPDAAHFDAYIQIAKSLREQLEANPGFVENLRYKSLTRPGWLLSLSIWRDEKALVHWRTRGRHHLAQEKGRDGVLVDYHLRVGQIVRGGAKSSGGSDGSGGSSVNGVQDLKGTPEERVDDTQVGDAKFVVLVDGLHRGGSGQQDVAPESIAREMGLDPSSDTEKLVSWDVMDAILSPGETILVTSWADETAAASFSDRVGSMGRLRCRQTRIIRDYGKYDRREAPQYYKDALGQRTLH